MTHAEYQGSEFVIKYNDPAVDVRGHSLHSKTQWYVTGNRSSPGNPPTLRSGSRFSVPERLGYDVNDTAGRTFGRAYLVTQAYDVQYSRASYFTPEQQRHLFVYGERALVELRADPTADRVYANGEYTVWNITPDE